jgi:hypothetical protein
MATAATERPPTTVPAPTATCFADMGRKDTAGPRGAGRLRALRSISEAPRGGDRYFDMVE